MLIYTKKSFMFQVDGDTFTTMPLEMVNMPEKFKNDPLFKWGVAEGSVVVNETKKEIQEEPKQTKKATVK